MTYNVQNKEDFIQELEDAGNKLVVIDFYSNWCGPCKIINPKLEELSLQYADKAKVLKVNVDDCDEIAMEYNITSMPTFVFIKNQQIVDMFVGGNVEKLANNIESYIEDEDMTSKEFIKNTPIPSDEIDEDEYSLYNELDVDDLQTDPSDILEVVVDEEM